MKWTFPQLDMQTFYLDDEAVVLASGRLYHLNASAALVWACLEEGMAPEPAAMALATGFGLHPEQAQAGVARLQALWHEAGLLTDGSGVPEDAPLEARVACEPPPAFRPAVWRRYRLLDSTFCVQHQSAESDRWVHPLLAHLVATDEPTHTLSIFRDGEGYEISHDGWLAGRCADLVELAPLVSLELLLSAYPEASALTAFHAGAVALNGRCALLPGESGSGKSTLTAALVADGLGLVSDEVGLLTRDVHAVRPVPVCLSLKDGAWPVLGSRYPDLSRLAVHRRLDGRQVRYLPPPTTSHLPDQPLPVAVVVFPRYRPGGATRLEAIPAGEALCRISVAGYDLIDLQDEHTVAELLAWLRGVPRYVLEYSSLDEACTTVRELLA
jgi:hypothetical protein